MKLARKLSERSYWNRTFKSPDPWDYTNEYEQGKYRHTLDMLPRSALGDVVEVGCAEGLFTRMLAPRAGRLLALDISDTALARARSRCADLDNVSFVRHDMAEGIPGREHDLIVCSEVLYYLRDRAAVERFARQVCGALRHGGHVLLTHSNMVSDDRSETGFDFAEIGAEFIGEIFSAVPELEFVRELRTELYRVQLFERAAPKPESAGEGTAKPPREVIREGSVDYLHPTIKRGGCITTWAEARFGLRTANPPVLMYHRVSVEGPAGLASYRVSPAMFERQLSRLQANGFHSMSMNEYWNLKFRRRCKYIPGKPIVITFDDAYEDFYTNAWPLLKRYGFGATVFVPTHHVGGSADWDAGYGAPASLMTWKQIVELNAQGVEFGSHARRHVPLVHQLPPLALWDAVVSKAVLRWKLGKPIRGFCYPYSRANHLTRSIVALAGYRYAVGGAAGGSARINPLWIPRIEVTGDDTLGTFMIKIPQPEAAEPAMKERYRELHSRRDRATYMDR